MENSQLVYIKRCKKLIEKKLDWSVASKDWKQRDYLNLIARLEEQTGTSLSLSTIKRIWREDYQGTPQPATLDALARFLNYDNWLSFQEGQKVQLSSPSSSKEPQKNENALVSRILVPISVLLFALLGYFIFSSSTNNKKPVLRFDPNDISFSATNSQPVGVPNTVIFNYDLGSIEADSFSIQQSWNPFNREKISTSDSVLTSIYYYPGVHTAKLIANDSIIKESTLRIYSDGWIAAVNYGMQDKLPTYINLGEKNDKPDLHISKEQLADYKLDIKDELNVSYFYVDEFEKISGDSFVLKARLQADSILNITCPSIGLLAMGTVETHYVKLIDKGCVNIASIKLGKKMVNGRNSDLSGLGVDVYEEQEIEIQVEDKKAKIYLGDQLIYQATYQESIGDITGFATFFSGTGKVVSLELKNTIDGNLIFEY